MSLRVRQDVAIYKRLLRGHPDVIPDLIGYPGNKKSSCADVVRRILGASPRMIFHATVIANEVWQSVGILLRRFTSRNGGKMGIAHFVRPFRTACGVRLLRARPNPDICGSHPHALSLRFKKMAGRWGLLTSFVLSGPPTASTTLLLRDRTPLSGFLIPIYFRLI